MITSLQVNLIILYTRFQIYIICVRSNGIQRNIWVVNAALALITNRNVVSITKYCLTKKVSYFLIISTVQVKIGSLAIWCVFMHSPFIKIYVWKYHFHPLFHFFLGQARELRFLSSLSFEGKYLANHVITTINVLDRDLCELRCYVESNCVSINYEVQPNASRTHKCDLNNSTHKEHDQDLESAPRYSYHGTNVRLIL